MKNLLVFALLLSVTMHAQKKHALIIAVGDYQYSDWSKISSVNDITLIKQSLNIQDFKDENIVTLINEKATYQGIKEAFNNLNKRIKPNDIVVIHISSHGQQISDNDGDEIDGLDEAIIPYDARAEYTLKYKGQRHLRDDDLGVVMTQFRNTLGKGGQLLLLLDSCYSGTATRGGITRGTSEKFIIPNIRTNVTGEKDKGSGAFESPNSNENLAQFVVISGSSANEKNYEYEGYGSLSFLFNQVMTNDLIKGKDLTFNQIFAKIREGMFDIGLSQRPTIEGDIDATIFNGNYKQQEKYYIIDKIINDTLYINQGKLNNLYRGTTFKLLEAGTLSSNSKEAVVVATIVEAKHTQSKLVFDRKFSMKNVNKYWLFMDIQTYGDLNVKTYLHSDISKELKNNLSNHLKKNNYGSIVDNETDANLIVEKDADFYFFYPPKGEKKAFRKVKRKGDDFDLLKDALFQYAQSTFLAKVKLKNPSYKMSFRLLPVELDIKVGEKFKDKSQIKRLDKKAFIKNGVFSVVPMDKELNAESDRAVLEVTNHSEISLYFNIIEILNSSKINKFFPNDKCYYRPDELKLKPKQTKVFEICGNGNAFTYVFFKPYEIVTLKAFAGPNPINFDEKIFRRIRSPQYPLEIFLNGTYAQKRGGDVDEANTPEDAYTYEFNYEIVKKRE